MLFGLTAQSRRSLLCWFFSSPSIVLLQNSAAASQENLRPADVTPAKKKKKKEVNVGQIEKWVDFSCKCALHTNTAADGAGDDDDGVFVPQVLESSPV